LKTTLLTLALLSLTACATATPHKQVSRVEERQALAAAEAAYREAFDAYTKAAPGAQYRSHNALAAAHSALEATRNAFETDGAPTFMDQAVAARKLAVEAKAAAS